jgi:hypothetical protein
MVSSNDIANEAVQLIGDNQPPVLSAAPNWDTSATGKALKYVYASVVATVARQFAWDMGRAYAALVLSGNAAPVGWAYEYVYPAQAPEVWQLTPATVDDANNPLPVNWSVGNALINSVATKVIWSNLANAVAVYNNNPPEAVWDPLFRQTVVRMLASELAMALAGKPDVSKTELENSSGFGNIAETRDS